MTISDAELDIAAVEAKAGGKAAQAAKEKVLAALEGDVKAMSNRAAAAWRDDCTGMAWVAVFGAIPGYDPDQGRFRPYARSVIRHAISHYRTERDHALHDEQRTDYDVLIAVRKYCSGNPEVRRDVGAIAEALGFAQWKVAQAMGLDQPISIDAPPSDEDAETLADMTDHRALRGDADGDDPQSAYDGPDEEIGRNQAAPDSAESSTDDGLPHMTPQQVVIFRASLPDDWTRALFDLRLGRILAETDERPLSVHEAIAAVNRTQTRNTNRLDLLLRERILRRDLQRHRPLLTLPN